MYIFTKIRPVFIVIIVMMLLAGCKTHQKTVSQEITVTIPPLKGLVESIVGNDFRVNVLLPEGATPETYSPTINQITSMEESEYVFFVGTLPFEKEILRSNRGEKFINVSNGIVLISGECKHKDNNAHHHHHSADPHIWFSLEELSKIVDNIENALMSNHPDSTKYFTNSQRVKLKIEGNLRRYQQMLTTSPKSFLIYHPAMGYIANSLEMTQIALENEGKSPTPTTLTNIINIVEEEDIEYMLYQKEYPIEVVQPIADILGVKLVQINPLSTSIIDEIDRVMNILIGKNEQ